MVAPETQDILDHQTDIDIPLPEPTQVSTVPDLKEIASEFSNYLLQQPNYSAYSSKACKHIYEVLPSSRELLNRYGHLRGLISLLKEENEEEHMFYNLTKHSMTNYKHSCINIRSLSFSSFQPLH